MRNQNKITNIKANASIKRAYVSYLFSSFWRRPVGYILPILYILYLAIIFIIVPKILNNNPLFIWNLTTFNIPIFSLFFLAAACAALAITIFRTSREDGTELSLSAKPLTKGSMVGLKVLVYLTIMLVVTAITVVIALLIKPIFGIYSSTNTHGISEKEYRGIVLSILVGNLVNILFFSGISVLISIVGGQVITMVSAIGIALVMVILNFIFGKVVKTPGDVISDQYQSTINSISTFTRKQMDSDATSLEPESFTGIQCYVNEDGEELHHYDTYEYWTKAEKKANANKLAYIDIGNQLASLFNGFGLEDGQLNDVKKLPIGSNATYKYSINESTHVAKQENIDDGEYPICTFTWREYQGKFYPVVTTLGPSLQGALSEWYLYSSAFGMNFYSITKISSGQTWYQYPGYSVSKKVNNELTLNINDILVTDEAQRAEIEEVCKLYINKWDYAGGNFFNNYLDTSSSGIWSGKFSDLNYHDKFVATSKLLTYIMVYAQELQNDEIKSYLDKTYPSVVHAFPYSTAEVVETFRNDSTFQRLVYTIIHITHYGYIVGNVDGKNLYCMMNNSDIPYCESFTNLYKYSISRLYSIPALTAIWGSIAIALFAVAIVVYKKTDFK